MTITLTSGQFNIVNKKFLSMVPALKKLEMEEIIQQVFNFISIICFSVTKISHVLRLK